MISAPQEKEVLPLYLASEEKASPRKLGQSILRFLDIDILLLGFILILLLSTLWWNDKSIHWGQASVVAPIVMMLFLILSRSIYWIIQKRKGLQTIALSQIIFHALRDWIPFIAIDFIYENLHDLSQIFYKRDYAAVIMNLDVKIFGFELTQWSQRFAHPLLTDYMAFTYALYIIFPLVLMYFLSYRNRRKDLKQIILALTFAFIAGFIGYVFVPCSPPRYFLLGHYIPEHLQGFLYNMLQARWDALSQVSAGAFPSLHVGISTVALIFAYRFRNTGRLDKVLFWIYLPLIVSLWASTVYLRHHWFIDILAGWTLAYVSCWLAPRLSEKWDEFRQNFQTLPETKNPLTLK